MLGEDRDVDPAVAQRREREANGVDAVEQVAAELAALHEAVDVAVGGGNDAGVHRHLLRPSGAEERPLLEDAEERSLLSPFERRHFVHEERPSRGQLEESGATPLGTGECTALVAEEFGLDRHSSHRRAGDVDQGASSAFRQAVDCARDQLLAGSRLAGDQDRGHAAGHPRHGVEDRAQPWVAGHQLGERVDDRQPLLEARGLARRLALFPRAPHEDVDLGHAVRLGEIVEGAEPHGADGCLHRSVAGDDDDLWRRRLVAHQAQHLESVAPRHHDIEERDVKRFAAKDVERGVAVAHDRHVVSARGQELLEERAEVFLVFGDEDTNGGRIVHASVLVGRRMRKVLPAPTALSTSMRPPCSVMMP